MKNRLVWIVTCLLIATLYGAACLRPIIDPDIYFQLLAGRYALEHMQVPHYDFFVYAGDNLPQIFGGWGFGAIYEIFIQFFGMAGSTFANSLIWGSCAGFIFACAGARASYSPRLPIFLAAAAAALVSLAAISSGFGARAGMRAESTLYLAWMAGSFFIYHSLEKKKWTLFLAGLPALAFCEAWLHTGGFLLLLLYPLAWFLHKESGAHQRTSLWAASFIGAILLPIANPNGAFQCYGQLINLVHSMPPLAASILSGIARAPEETIILEYLPLSDPRTSSVWPAFCALSLASLACLSCLFGPKRINQRSFSTRLYFALLIGAGLSGAFIHQRGIGFAACFISLPFLDTAFYFFSTKKLKSFALCLICLAFFAMAMAEMAYPFWGIQNQTTEFSSLAKIIKDKSPDGARIFAGDLDVGLVYILGPKYKIAHAGHELIVNPVSNAHNLSVLNADVGFIEDLDRFKVDYLCLRYLLPMPSQSYLYWAPSMLATRNDWKLLENSGSCSLFAKMPPGQTLTPRQVKIQTLAYLSRLRDYNLYALALYNNPSDREISEATEKKIKKLTTQLEEETAGK